MWFSRHVMHRNCGVHGLFRSSGVTGVTLRLGVQTDDVRCVVALFFRHGMRGHHGTARFIFYSIVGRTPCGCPFRSSGVAGVTLRLGVQTDDMWCVVAPVIVVGAGFARPITLYIFEGTDYTGNTGTDAFCSKKIKPWYSVRSLYSVS